MQRLRVRVTKNLRKCLGTNKSQVLRMPLNIDGPACDDLEPKPVEQPEPAEQPEQRVALPELAAELIDEILGYSDRPTLRACALAIRSWLPNIRRILFRSASIMPKGPDGYLPLLHSLASSPELCTTMRSLRFNGCFLFNNNNFCSHLLSRMLLLLPALESLHIRCVYLNHLSPIPFAQSLLKRAAQPVHTASPVPVIRNCKFHLPSPRPFKLRHLTIDVTEIGDENLQELLDVLCLFSEIDCLELYRDGRYAHAWTTSRKHKYPSLLIRELKSEGALPPTLQYLQASIAAHSLNAIELTLEQTSDINNLGALLFEVGSDIHSLTLFPSKVFGWQTRVNIRIEWWQLMNLSCCKNIKVFKLVIDHGGRDCYNSSSVPDSCLDILTCVPETVQRIVLCIRESLAQHLRWDRLEQILLNYKGLRKVAIEPWVTPSTRDVEYMKQARVEELLQKVQARNLFEVAR